MSSETGTQPKAETRQERFDRGMEILSRVACERVDGGRRVVDALTGVSPELGHQVVAWTFGEIYDRPGLSLRDRELVTLDALAALGGCEPQLEVHGSRTRPCDVNRRSHRRAAPGAPRRPPGSRPPPHLPASSGRLTAPRHKEAPQSRTPAHPRDATPDHPHP